MANVGKGPAGYPLTGRGTSSPSGATFLPIGTESGLTAHGVVLAEGNGAFVATSAGTTGQVFTSNGPGSDPSFQNISPGIVTSLTPDVGAAVPGVAGTIPTLGYDAGTVQTMRTYNDGAGNFRIADQTWQTQYVVDASTTNGLRGTFTTIQAALNQAVTDGMTFTSQRVIYIRRGSYAENLTIPGGAILVGETFASPIGGVITPTGNTLIVGAHTFTGNAVWGANNIIFETTAGDLFNGGSAAIVLGYLCNCFLVQAGADQLVNAMPASSSFNFTNCTFNGGGDTTQFTTSNMVSMSMVDCLFGQQMNFVVDGTQLNLINCNGLFALSNSGVGNVALSNGAVLFAQSCLFTTSSNYCISGSGAGPSVIYDCTFGGILAGIQSTAASSWTLRNCSTLGVGLVYQNGTPVELNRCIQGNIIKSTTTAGNLNLTGEMYYVGVTSTAAPRTITLPDGSGGSIANQNQTFIIKDESGGAGTNVITVTTQGGTVLIDGATSQLIDVNYASMTVRFDGTNYFII
jgi:hypothetical protein